MPCRYPDRIVPGSEIATDRDHVIGTGRLRVRKPERTRGWVQPAGAHPFNRTPTVPLRACLGGIASLGSLIEDQGATIATHEVLNQPPPLDGYDMAAAEPTLIDALERNGAGWAVDAVTVVRSTGGIPEVYEWGFTRQSPLPRTSHSRPIRQQGRQGRVPPGLAPPSRAVGRSRACIPFPGSRPSPRPATSSNGPDFSRQPDRGRSLLSDFDDLRRPARPCAIRRISPPMWEPKILHACLTTRPFDRHPEKTGLLMGMGMTEKQGGSDVRAGTTQGCAGRRRLPDNRAQVVHVGTHERRLLDPRPGAGRPHLFPASRASDLTAPSTRFESSASRTSSATDQTPRPRSSSRVPMPARLVRKGGAWRRSSKWSTAPGSTA